MYKVEGYIFYFAILLLFIFLIDIRQKLIKCTLNVPKMHENVCPSPKFSLALSMFI